MFLLGTNCFTIWVGAECVEVQRVIFIIGITAGLFVKSYTISVCYALLQDSNCYFCHYAFHYISLHTFNDHQLSFDSRDPLLLPPSISPDSLAQKLNLNKRHPIILSRYSVPLHPPTSLSVCYPTDLVTDFHQYRGDTWETNVHVQNMTIGFWCLGGPTGQYHSNSERSDSDLR